MKNCIIYSKNPVLYESNLTEDDSEFNLKGLNKLISHNGKISFVNSKNQSLKTPKEEFCVLIEDDYENIAKLVKYSHDSGKIDDLIVCTDADSAQLLIDQFNKEPDLITLDFQLRNDDKFIEETIKLYRNLKDKWKDVPIMGITNWESENMRKGVSELIELINKNWDSVYDKQLVWKALPTILRDKVRISRLNRDIEIIKQESKKKEQTIVDLEIKSKYDYVSLYFDRKIDITKIEEVNPRDIYRRYNLISSNSFVTKCLLFKVMMNAATDDSIIVAGPIGSGKDILPKIIHDHSNRRHKKYEVYNCTTAYAADAKIIITELFGAVKGVVQGTEAQPGVLRRNNGGTVFLDEVHHLPKDIQIMFLRVIENDEVTPLGGEPEKIDVRIIVGTNQNINQLIKEDKFHSDLFSRLCGDIIVVPTLEQRGKEEIIEIAKFFLSKYCEKQGIKRKSFSVKAINKIAEYSYSNYHIRELEKIVASAARYSFADTIHEEEIVLTLPEFKTDPRANGAKTDAENTSREKGTLTSFRMNKSKEWLRCIIKAIAEFGDKSDISSREIIKVFVSPSGGMYHSDAAFSPAIKAHTENFLALIETEEFIQHREEVLKLKVIRLAYANKLNNTIK